jgi:hypothetical protein
MVADSSIDGQFDWFFACFIVPLRFLATHALPASMAAYVYAMELNLVITPMPPLKPFTMMVFLIL